MFKPYCPQAKSIQNRFPTLHITMFQNPIHISTRQKQKDVDFSTLNSKQSFPINIEKYASLVYK